MNLLQVSAGSASPMGPGSSVWLGAQWFKQTLDHFKRGDNPETFDQKYFVDDTHYDGSGPIILYINGEAPLYSAPGASSFTGYMAQQMKAMTIALEHRFYGDSHPFADMSTSSLRYLNGAQALLDLRNFRIKYNEQLGPRPDGSEHKWVVVGGSYAGSLAAWSRSRFPHLFAAAHASSAPIEAIDTYTRFDEQLQQSLSPSCKDMVRQVNHAIDERLGSPNATAPSPSARAVKKLFDAEALSNDDFSYLAADAVAIAVQVLLPLPPSLTCPTNAPSPLLSHLSSPPSPRLSSEPLLCPLARAVRPEGQAVRPAAPGGARGRRAGAAGRGLRLVRQARLLPHPRDRPARGVRRRVPSARPDRHREERAAVAVAAVLRVRLVPDVPGGAAAERQRPPPPPRRPQVLLVALPARLRPRDRAGRRLGAGASAPPLRRSRRFCPSLRLSRCSCPLPSCLFWCRATTAAPSSTRRASSSPSAATTPGSRRGPKAPSPSLPAQTAPAASVACR